MSDGPFLYSDITVESPEFEKKPPSLQLSCQSSTTSLRSVSVTNDLNSPSSYSEESRVASDSGTVIQCSNGNSQGSSYITEEDTQSTKGTIQTSRSDYDTNCSIDSRSKGSRLDHVLERIFVQVSPEGDIKINHLACLFHVQQVIRKNVKDAQILVFDCQESDSNITEMFDKVYDCCFDLDSRPNLEFFICFCETCYNWLAESTSNVVLFHSESSVATRRLLVLLYAYAAFCDSVERQNIRTNRRLKAYLSVYPNGNISVPVAFLRYAGYMKIYSPFRKLSISRASMSIHSIVLYNTPLFTNQSVNIFLKIYSYFPLRHIYTTNIHTISDHLNKRTVLLFTEEPIRVRGDVIILCYYLKNGQTERERLFKLLFHSCEGYDTTLTFKYDAFQEIWDAVPGTFRLDLNLLPTMEALKDSSQQSNIFVENIKDVQKQDARNISLNNCIDAVNIIESRNVTLDAIRLSDSLEDIDHIPNRSSFLASSQEIDKISRDFVRNQSLTFNEFFMNAYGNSTDEKQWRLQPRVKRKAPKRPPPLDPQFVKALRESRVMDRSSYCGTSDRSSIDSGTSLHSDSSDASDKSLKDSVRPKWKKFKKKLKSIVETKNHKKSEKQSESLDDAEVMPPPTLTEVPRSKLTQKSVAFLNATPTKIPPPRPVSPQLANGIEVNKELMARQGKTPAGIRSVPTKYFGPKEKYQRLAEKDFDRSRSYRLQLHQAASDRSTPTILEDQEAEDFEEAEYRQLQKEGYNFSRHLPGFHSGSMSTTAATQDLDQLLEELRRTSLDYAPTSARSPSTHSSRLFSSQQRSAFAEPGAASTGSRYYNRSYSFTGSGGNRLGGGSGRWTNMSSSATSSSYQRSQAFSTDRGLGGSRSSGTQTGESSSGHVRHSTPAPQLASSNHQRYQTTFRTTLQHRPPTSPKRFNQINVTIDPEFGTSSLLSDNCEYLTPTMSRVQVNAGSTNAMEDTTDGMSYRELQLLEELSSTRQELAMLKRATSVVDEPHHKLPPPSTLPTQRRAVHGPQHQESIETFSNRHRSQYQSHHDIQESSLHRPHGRYDTLNSGFGYSVPKRAMSSANVTSSQSWNYRNGIMSGPQSPAPGYSSMRSIGGSVRSGGAYLGSQGYSARRERLKQEAEQAEALRRSTQRMNSVAASSNDLRSTSLHQQRRQHYHSMSTIRPERTDIEEIETVTLQPIGRGVQDLGSNMGSTATLNRAGRRPVASSMLEGLNRVEAYRSNQQSRANVTSFGRQTSAVDIPQTMSAKPQRASSNSFLSSLRRQSVGTVSDAGSFQTVPILTNKPNGFSAQQPRQQIRQHTQQSTTTYTSTMQQSHSQSQPQAQPLLIQSSSQQVKPQQMHQQQHPNHQTQHLKQEMDWSNANNNFYHPNSNTNAVNIAAPVPVNGQMADLSLVEATSPIWYRLKMSRQEAISILKNQPTGSFLVRDSTTFKDAYGLAVKSTKQPSKPGQKSGFAKFMKNILNDINNESVRHYLIETVTTPVRGVRIKGFSAEQVFPNLLALIQHHTQYPVALPCCLVLPPIPPSQTSFVINTAGNASLRNGNSNTNGDSDSITLVQNNGSRSLNQTPTNFNGNGASGAAVTAMHEMSKTGGESLEAPTPSRSITSPLSPTMGMFHSELISPPPNISCRCLYLGAVEVDMNQPEQANLMAAVDTLIPGPVMQATACDQLGAESPVQYTECQLQAAHNEGILLTDLSRKLFFQRHFSANSFIYAGVDPRDKAFIHPNHSALGIDKPKLFGFIIKKLSGENMAHIFSEFDVTCGASIVTAQINSLLLNK